MSNDQNPKPHAESCNENTLPILNIIQPRLSHCKNVLEIGSGTGQHAVSFGQAMPHLQWQTSDLKATHEGILMWLEEAKLPNLLPPLELDTYAEQWPIDHFDAIFTANTLHIIAQEGVEKLFQHIAKHLSPKGEFMVYGPFMYHGKHTSESNERFDEWLHSKEITRGIRDIVWLKEVAAKNGLELDEDIEMPVNNRILVWRHR